MSTEAARIRAALGIRWAPIKLQEPVWVAAPDLCPYPALPPEAPLWSLLGWTRSVIPLAGGGEEEESGLEQLPPPEARDWWGLGERVCVPA